MMENKDELGFKRGSNLYFHGRYSYHDASLSVFTSKIMKVLLIAEELGVAERFIHDCEECGFYHLGNSWCEGLDMSDDHDVETMKMYMLQNLLADILKAHFSEDEELKEIYIRNPEQKICVVINLQDKKKG